MNMLKKPPFWGIFISFFYCYSLFFQIEPAVSTTLAMGEGLDEDTHKLEELKLDLVGLRNNYAYGDHKLNALPGVSPNDLSMITTSAPGAITESDIKAGTQFDCYRDTCECGVNYCSSTQYRCIHGLTTHALLERLNKDYDRQNYERNYEKCVNHKPGKAIKGYDADELSGLCLKGYFRGDRQGHHFTVPFNLRVNNHKNRNSRHRYDLTIANQPASSDSSEYKIVSVDGMKLKAIGEDSGGYKQVHYRLLFSGSGDIGVRNNKGEREVVFFRGFENQVRLYSVYPDDFPNPQDIFYVKMVAFNGKEYKKRIREKRPVLQLAVIERVVECQEEASDESEQEGDRYDRD